MTQKGTCQNLLRLHRKELKREDIQKKATFANYRECIEMVETMFSEKHHLESEF